MKKVFCAFFLLFVFVFPLSAQSLRGSESSVMKTYNQALRHNFTFLRDAAHIQRFVKTGLLVRLSGNANYKVDEDVSYNFARPAVKLFVERFSVQMETACGEEMEITSLTRPKNEQPSNASDFSVHPTGMSVDFRVPKTRKCRQWVNRTLLALERNGVLEATREHYPPHYHVAIFPNQYESYVKNLQRRKK